MIRYEGLDVGRVDLTRVRAGDRWLWPIFMNGHVPQIPNVPISGLAVTLDEAASQFKQSYEAMRTKAGIAKAAAAVALGAVVAYAVMGREQRQLAISRSLTATSRCS